MRRFTGHSRDAETTPLRTAMLRLLARPVGQPHDREPRNAGLEMRLDLDAARLEAYKRLGDGTCEHSCHRRHRGARKGHAPVPSSLRNVYGV